MIGKVAFKKGGTYGGLIISLFIYKQEAPMELTILLTLAP